jgi:prepilin-type N-terminal cleavage/methylation domain-containing protein
MTHLRRAFTLIELLVVIAIIAILAAILFPVFAQVKESGKKTVCLSNLKQIGFAFEMYLTDYDQRLPDRRDLKQSLPGGWKPWTSWPASDPRAGWAAIVLEPYLKNTDVWTCPTVKGSIMSDVVQVKEATSSAEDAPVTRYWLWRFDQFVDPIPLDDLWGKTPEQSVVDLQAANNPQAGYPQSTADIEIAVDPYFPDTIPTVDPALKGAAAHRGGRNRLLLDSHVAWFRDIRLKP